MNSGIDAVKVAVELGAEVNAANEDGDTALHLAAFHGFKTVVRFLVSQGANLDVKNERGETPLERAMRNGAPARMSRSTGGRHGHKHGGLNEGVTPTRPQARETTERIMRHGGVGA